MSHISISVPNSIEFLNIEPTQISPLISKCQIKVCYVGDEPNRNRSVITKEVATEMAPSLRGCPIVGFYNEATEDFEEHNRIIDISNGKFEIKDTTRPYGFVGTDAPVWFEKFTDDGVEHEYLMTEGYIWTGQYEESKRIIEKGNNQSMELDENLLDAYWTKDVNGKAQFFIINEAVMSKLCILGEDVEPCFEGSSITAKIEFSFDDGIKSSLFALIDQMKQILNEGGTSMFNTYAVEIGNTLWEALWDYLYINYPGEDRWCSKYRVRGIYEENGQKFMVVSECSDNAVLYRIDFEYDENGLVVSDQIVKVEEKFVPIESQFNLEDIEAYAAEFKKSQEAKSKKEEEKEPEEDDDEGKASEGEEGKEEQDPEPDKDDKDPEDDEEDEKKKKFALEEELTSLQAELAALVDEYAKLEASAAELQTALDNLTAETETYKATIAELTNFKLAIERKEKEDMINNTFYMLDAEYKTDVIENIDKYSLDDIEAKLSVICVRNKINMDMDHNNTDNNQATLTYNLSGLDDDDNLPAWFKAVRDVEKNMNK